MGVIREVRMRVRALAAATLLVLMASAAWAQNGAVNGRVSKSEGGAAISGAEVTLRPLPAPGAPSMPNMPGMNTDRTTQSRADGTFSFTQIAAGQYVLFADFAGFERTSQLLTVANQPLTVTLLLEALVIPGAEPAAAAALQTTDLQVLLERIRQLEQRVVELEATTVLSEPEVRVKQIEVYTDANGNQFDEPKPGTKKTVTYQRERVFRRQVLSEKIEEALASEGERKVALGVSAASVTQFSGQTKGAPSEFSGHAYQLASADFFFSAGIAQYTSFFADIVGLSGSSPDREIEGLTLLNAYTARLVNQNEINIREAWVKTELFAQRLSIIAGHLDLTNFFDRNAFANDETAQFISDALVNNPTLGLSENGAGVAGVFDLKNGFALKAGIQQSNSQATNLSQSLFSLGEVDYVARPPGLSEGNYRVWFRHDNSADVSRSAIGVSADQKLNAVVGVFGRYGSAEAEDGRDTFFSAGAQFQNAAVFYPLDYWGVGYSQTELEGGELERLFEGYYNFQISERLRLSLHVAHSFQKHSDVGFLVPAIRLQATF